MLSIDRFHHYKPDNLDKWAFDIPLLRLTDLKLKSKRNPQISVLISTYNRQAQLQRALECYARQKYRNFEILLNDDGSTQDIKAIVDKFSPFLNIQYFKTERNQWVSCPSKAFAMMYPHAQGKVIVVTHPEMMLAPNALQYICDVLLQQKIENSKTYIIDQPNYTGETPWAWISLRPNFFDAGSQLRLDGIDWHSNIHNIQTIPNWKNIIGFAGRPNFKHDLVPGYPWWFVGAALRDCPIWKDTPITEGHANIDMFWCYYRKKYKFLDVVPDDVMCYHQVHQVSAVAPAGEQASIIPEGEGAKCVYNW